MAGLNIYKGDNTRKPACLARPDNKCMYPECGCEAQEVKMAKYTTFRIEVNVGRRDGSESVWHYLMEDEFSPCEFDNEEEARRVVVEENRGANIRIVGFTVNGIGAPLP